MKTSATVLGMAQPQAEHDKLTDDCETNMLPWNYQELNCMLGLWNTRTVGRFLVAAALVLSP